MNDNYAGVLVLAGIVLLNFMIGFWSASAFWKEDTFNCTNTCSGRHSIYNTDTKICYCEAETK